MRASLYYFRDWAGRCWMLVSFVILLLLALINVGLLNIVWFCSHI